MSDASTPAPGRDSARDSALTNIVGWRIEGRFFEIDLFDIDGLEWRDARRVTGLTREELIRRALEELDFEAVATFWWLARRRDDPELDHEAVLREVSYRSFVAGGPAEGDAAGPDPAEEAAQSPPV